MVGGGFSPPESTGGDPGKAVLDELKDLHAESQGLFIQPTHRWTSQLIQLLAVVNSDT